MIDTLYCRECDDILMAAYVLEFYNRRDICIYCIAKAIAKSKNGGFLAGLVDEVHRLV